MMRRLQIRPVVSRHLRVALLLVNMLAVVGLMQTRLSGWPLLLGSALLLATLGRAWWHLYQAGRLSDQTLLLSFRPFKLELQTAGGAQQEHRCVSLSVYRWLIVMRFQPANPAGGAVSPANRTLVLLPDSLPGATPDDWRLMLIWARQMRRQISSGKGAN